jgi:hypothetical protein
MSEAQNPEKKIFVDEDWKSQVEAEREELRRTGEAAAPQPPTEDEALPPPGLPYLVSTLYLQAAISLGLLPSPVTGKPEVRLGTARHAIDTLSILQEKTEGHRTPDESEELEAVLHQLRLAYVEVARVGTGPAAPSP